LSEFPLHEFGGDGPAIHLAPANGFPPGSYRAFAGMLTGRYRIVSLVPRSLWPGSRPESVPTWRPLAGDLVAGLDALGVGGVVGVGHSLGGVLTLWAAIDRSDLFRAVVLIDPVILPPGWLRWLRLLRLLGLRQRQPLVQGALHRRCTWPDRQACFAHFRLKSFFAPWSDEALWDHVEASTRPLPGGDVELVWPREWEAHVFATTPLRIWRDVPRLRVPALIVRGEHSATFVPEAQARLARLLPQAQFVTVAGAGHLAPLERPAETAEVLRPFLDDIRDLV